MHILAGIYIYARKKGLLYLNELVNLLYSQPLSFVQKYKTKFVIHSITHTPSKKHCIQNKFKQIF